MQDAIGMLIDQSCMVEHLSEELHAKANTANLPLANEYRGLAVILANHQKALDEIEAMLCRLEQGAKEAA